MSNGDFPWLNNGTSQPPPQAAGVTDIVNKLQGIISQLTALVKATNGGARAFGIFTATSGTTSVVANPAVQGNSIVQLMPTNSAASSFVKTNGYFITVNAGTGFTVTFGGSAAGTETFSYLVNTPN
jgi:hypothetical protein